MSKLCRNKSSFWRRSTNKSGSSSAIDTEPLIGLNAYLVTSQSSNFIVPISRFGGKAVNRYKNPNILRQLWYGGYLLAWLDSFSFSRWFYWLSEIHWNYGGLFITVDECHIRRGLCLPTRQRIMSQIEANHQFL